WPALYPRVFHLTWAGAKGSLYVLPTEITFNGLVREPDGIEGIQPTTSPSVVEIIEADETKPDWIVVYRLGKNQFHPKFKSGFLTTDWYPPSSNRQRPFLTECRILDNSCQLGTYRLSFRQQLGGQGQGPSQELSLGEGDITTKLQLPPGVEFKSAGLSNEAIV